MFNLASPKCIRKQDIIFGTKVCLRLDKSSLILMHLYVKIVSLNEIHFQMQDIKTIIYCSTPFSGLKILNTCSWKAVKPWNQDVQTSSTFNAVLKQT